ncbi:MAG: FTR1 family iron permease [Deltaproteobacteria bacterium]|jgi:high-affinity iron transporter|nr:FTR1 family iron permease [Deltaproteobacteria bacterium]
MLKTNTLAGRGGAGRRGTFAKASVVNLAQAVGAGRRGTYVKALVVNLSQSVGAVVASVVAAVLAVTLLASAPPALAASKYKSWGEIAEAMGGVLDQAYDSYAKGQSDEAFDFVNDAYFGYYEKEGFERNVKGRISGKRTSQVEYKFAVIKQKIRDGAPADEVRGHLTELATWLVEDAEKLDARTRAQRQAATGTAAGGEAATSTAAAPEVAASGAGEGTMEGTGEGTGVGTGEGGLSGHDWAIFLAAFGTLLREGFEAILVIAAIAAYLLRSGNRQSVKVVYVASVAAVVVSGLAAAALKLLFANLSGAKQEIIEGLTMLLATVVLFCVSNWMFSKAEAEAWKQYIETKVKMAVTTGSAAALAAAAFLAVFREGAETILFYQGILSEAGTDTTMVWAGFAVGCLALVAVFIIIRHGSMRLPLKPFFLGTSILMFIMSISFVGGGIKELQEGDAIPTTMIEGFPTVDILGIYPTLQTLIPQILLLALTVLSIVIIRQRNQRLKMRAAEVA